MKNRSICLLLILAVFSISCKENKEAQRVEHSDHSVSKIIVERGAFHNDTFVLQDSIVEFVPSDNAIIEEFPQYTVASQSRISQKEHDMLFKQIIDKGFFELRDSYKSPTSDNSFLRVTVDYNGRKKSVQSEDFKRNCPEVLKFIENEMVRFHGKNLKRQLLPG